LCARSICHVDSINLQRTFSRITTSSASLLKGLQNRRAYSIGKRGLACSNLSFTLLVDALRCGLVGNGTSWCHSCVFHLQSCQIYTKNSHNRLIRICSCSAEGEAARAFGGVLTWSGRQKAFAGLENLCRRRPVLYIPMIIVFYRDGKGRRYLQNPLLRGVLRSGKIRRRMGRRNHE
jgi:hypothetical protein